MVRMAASILTLLLVLSGCRSVLAAGMVRLECGHDEMCNDLSLVDAMQRESASEAELKKCAKGACIPAITQSSACPSDPVYWASVEKLGGQTEFDALLGHAASGDLFNGTSRIVEILGTPAGERHLALCQVPVIGGHEGLPRDCNTVAIISSGKTLIKGTRPRTLCEVSAVVGMDGATIKINFDIQTKLDAAPLSASLASMLKNDLGLDFDQQVDRDASGNINSVYYSAIAPLRDSKILGGGLRESFNFDISLSRYDGGFRFYGRSKPMICRTASGNVTEYHGLDDAQRNIYGKALNNGVASAVQKSCAAFSQIDDGTLSCK